MFGKKKPIQKIDQEQLELITYAQKRISQKKRFYTHVIFFFIVTSILLIFNILLKLGDNFTVFGNPWSIIFAVVWFLFLMYHAIKVYILNTFMNAKWEKQQLEKLVNAQKARIEKLKATLKKEDIHIAKSEIYNKQLMQTIPNLTLIVATAEANEIGKNNDLIWHLRNDLKRFKALTSGHCIIMGRKTFESFPKPLPNRLHIVITRQADYKVPEGVIVVNSLEEAFTKIPKTETQPFVIGGGEIYKQAIPFTEKIELTKVHANFDADTFFPQFDLGEWKEINNEFHKKDEQHDYEFSFITYVRK
ncbi:dihydrofolate reductase [Aurantibacter sp.]|uniref:dihydrofolate reductase n=1 Tax=Aurantibacter sp. TaxID=2807103 RepID=UPI0035C7BBBD